MIKKENYVKLKEKYGNIASWAIWDDDDISGHDWCLNDDELMKNIETKYVLVALNPYGGKNAKRSKKQDKSLPWNQNFHTSANDCDLRDAIRGTSFWGSYITDLFKKKPSEGQNSLEKKINENDEKEAVDELEEEIALISDNVILIALGDKVFDYLNKYLSGPYIIRKIRHFAYRFLDPKEYHDEIDDLTKRLDRKSI